MRILGISAFYHDSAAALIGTGASSPRRRRSASRRQQARRALSRAHAVDYCLSRGRRRARRELDHVVFYDKPFLKFERLLETYLAFAPRGFRSFRMAMPLWLQREAVPESAAARASSQTLDAGFDREQLLFTEHHLSHAASAFFPSPFERGGDPDHGRRRRVGHDRRWRIGRGSTHRDAASEIHFPHSLGLLYSAFTYYTGFKVNSGEYKLMGLAPYGEPRFAADRSSTHLIDLKPDGSFRLDQRYFDYCTGLTMTNERFDALFGGPPRKPEALLDAAAHGPGRLDPGRHRGGRAAPDAVARRRDRRAQPVPGRRRGAQLRGQRQDPARRAASSASGSSRPRATPAARSARPWRPGTMHLGQAARDHRRRSTRMRGAYLGPGVRATPRSPTRLAQRGARFATLTDDALVDADRGRAGRRARRSAGSRAGWSSARARSAPARSSATRARPTMQKTLNLQDQVPRDRSAPSRPRSCARTSADWFELDGDSPYMLLVADVRRAAAPRA